MNNLTKPINFRSLNGLNYKVFDYKWFNNKHGGYGVVLAEYNGQQRAYFSLISGINETLDINTILEWGFKLNYFEARGFFGDLVNKDTYKY